VEKVSAAGLVKGKSNPLSPVAVDKSRGWPVLHVNGEEYMAMGPRTTTAEALRQALAAAGVTGITVEVAR
jgi:hypothetical protein